MDSHDDIAEERLLRVIEGEQGKTGGTQTPQKPRPWPRSFRELRALLASRWARPVEHGTDRLTGTLQTVSRLFWVVLAAGAVYLAVDVATLTEMPRERFAGPSRMPAQDIGGEEDAAPVTVEVPLQDEAYYLNSVRERNPFTGASEVTVETVVEERGPSAQEKLRKMTDGLSVVGINRGDVKDAILEDAIQQRTHFVKAGDKIGDITVKEIRHDTVVLGYEDAEIEIG